MLTFDPTSIDLSSYTMPILTTAGSLSLAKILIARQPANVPDYVMMASKRLAAAVAEVEAALIERLDRTADLGLERSFDLLVDRIWVVVRAQLAFWSLYHHEGMALLSAAQQAEAKIDDGRALATAADDLLAQPPQRRFAGVAGGEGSIGWGACRPILSGRRRPKLGAPRIRLGRRPPDLGAPRIRLDRRRRDLGAPRIRLGVGAAEHNLSGHQLPGTHQNNLNAQLRGSSRDMLSRVVLLGGAWQRAHERSGHGQRERLHHVATVWAHRQQLAGVRIIRVIAE